MGSRCYADALICFRKPHEVFAGITLATISCRPSSGDAFVLLVEAITFLLATCNLKLATLWRCRTLGLDSSSLPHMADNSQFKIPVVPELSVKTLVRR